MGIMSTYQQSISVEHGINGLSLATRLIADGMLRKDDDGTMRFTAASGVEGRCWSEFLADDQITEGGLTFSWYHKNGNEIACTFKAEDVHDFLDAQLNALKTLSEKYPDFTFHIHSSYCPGGCGRRVTALDDDVCNGVSAEELAIEEHIEQQARVYEEHMRDFFR